MAKVCWDTNLFIYLIESSDALADRTVRLVESMLRRGDELYATSLTLGEVLVKPYRAGDFRLARQYEEILSPPNVELIQFDAAASRLFARIRAENAIRQPDAIQLACAASAGCSLFLTNDERLSNVRVKEIDFILPLTRSPI